MNRSILLATVLTTSLLFGGCSLSTQSTPTPSSQQKKNINTTLEGTIVQTPTGLAIQTGAPTPTGVDSYDLPMKNYLQQKVRITGQYSGDTLFVDKIELLP